MPSISSLCNSAHISIRAVAGIFWSSGNEPKSIKHSFSIISLSSRASKLLWRQLRSSSSELTMDWPSDNFVSVLLQISTGCPWSDLPTTSRASGNPLQRLTICSSAPAPNKISSGLQGNKNECRCDKLM